MNISKFLPAALRKPTQFKAPSDRFIYVNSMVAVVAALEWRAIPSEKLEHLRESSSTTVSEESRLYYAWVGNRQNTGLAGWLVRTTAEVESVLPKNIVSIAAAFWHFLGDASSRQSAVLLLRTSDFSDAPLISTNERYVVVGVKDGIITEGMYEPARASEFADQYSRVYTNLELDAFENAISISLKSLEPHFAKATLKRTPFNYVPLAIMATVLVLALSATMGFKVVQKRKAAAAAEAERQKRDPVKLYAQALAASQPLLNVERSDWQAALQKAQSMTLKVPGWEASKVECSVDVPQLLVSWNRKGGTYEELRTALAGQQIVLSTQSPQDKTLQHATAMSQVPCPVKRSPYVRATDGSLLPSAEQFKRNLSAEQEFITANFKLRITSPIPFPMIDADINQVPQRIERGEYELGGIPGLFASEALAALPANVVVEKFLIDVVHTDPKNALKITFTGKHYVKP